VVIRAEQVTGVITHHGEGPAWDADAGVLRLVDMLAGDVVTLDVPVRRQHVGDVAAAWRPCRDGGLVVAVERGFVLVDSDGAVGPLIPAFADVRLRMNDGACDPRGRFYCGSMAYDARPGAGTVYRLDTDLTVHPVLNGVTISNGMAWSLDGHQVFYVDSATRRIDAFGFDAEGGRFLERRPLVTLDHLGAEPDGLTIDSEGALWVALWGGSAVHRYSPAGELLEVVEVGARQVSACAFGGADLDVLYVTTSRQGLADHEDPAAGAVFAVRPGVRGAPSHQFAGRAG
jgi:sugar lactone lactonase YvrE